MKRFLRSFFLTPRFFLAGWLLVGLYGLAFVWPVLLLPANVLVALLALVTLVDTFLLYRVRNGISAARTTLHKWSNGDENPVSIEVTSRYPQRMDVRVLDEGGQIEAACELELLGEPAIFGGRLLVVSDLADRDDAVLPEIARHERDDARRDALVVRLFRVERQGAEMADAELARPKRFPPEQRGEIVFERADVSTGLTDPECGLDDDGDARGRHCLVIGSGARAHVDVGIEDLHGEPSNARSVGTGRPAARRSAA